MMRRTLILLVVCLLLPRLTAAQVVLNPKTIEFAPSPSHSATDPLSGVAVVTRYNLDCTGTGGTPVNKDLGKPAPVAGLIGPISPPEFLTLTGGVAFTCIVNTVGPGGTTPSLPSLPLGIAGPMQAPAAVPSRPVVK